MGLARLHLGRKKHGFSKLNVSTSMGISSQLGNFKYMIMHNLNQNHVSQRAYQAAPIDSVSEGVKDGVPKPRGRAAIQGGLVAIWWRFLQLAIHQLTLCISSSVPGDWPDAGLRQPHSMHFLCCAQFGASVSTRIYCTSG